jgi:hypothetical protein
MCATSTIAEDRESVTMNPARYHCTWLSGQYVTYVISCHGGEECAVLCEVIVFQAVPASLSR